MTSEQHEQVNNALVEFVLRVSGSKEIKTPEEVEVLPAIVKILMEPYR